MTSVRMDKWLSLNVLLELGGASQSVTVSARAPLLQSQTSSDDTFIENETVRNMPLASRRAGGLLRLISGVTFISEETWEGIPNFSLDGGRGRQQQWTLDGGNLQGVMQVTGIVDNMPPVSATQEMRVEANGYPAEFGRTTGGFISMTTRSGTNHFHGEAYSYIVKIDHAFSDRDHIMGRWLYFKSPQDAARVYPNPAADTAVDQLSDQFHIVTSWVHIFSSSKSNELLYNYNRRSNLAPALFPSTIAKDAGLSGVALNGTPTVQVAGYSQIGPSNQFRNAGPGFESQIKEAFLWTVGRHEFKFGGQVD